MKAEHGLRHRQASDLGVAEQRRPADAPSSSDLVVDLHVKRGQEDVQILDTLTPLTGPELRIYSSKGSSDFLLLFADRASAGRPNPDGGHRCAPRKNNSTESWPIYQAGRNHGREPRDAPHVRANPRHPRQPGADSAGPSSIFSDTVTTTPGARPLIRPPAPVPQRMRLPRRSTDGIRGPRAGRRPQNRLRGTARLRGSAGLPESRPAGSHATAENECPHPAAGRGCVPACPAAPVAARPGIGGGSRPFAPRCGRPS
jgi:hypothetical protein